LDRVVFEEAGERVVTDGIGYPGGDGLVGVIFHDEEGAAGVHVGFHFLNKDGLVFYIMEGVGHEDAVEWGKVERVFYEVGLEGDDRGGLLRAAGGEDGLLPDGRVGVDAIDSAARREQLGQCCCEKTGAAAEVGPLMAW